MAPFDRPPSAGQSVDDHCRVCGMERGHTVLAVDASRRLVRVMCGTCGSQHNFRGGGPVAGTTAAIADAAISKLVRESEPGGPGMNDGGQAGADEFEQVLRRVIREEAGLTPVAPARKWHGGEFLLRPADSSLKEKSWPIETFFNKVVAIRNRLRNLEQQVNAAEIPTDLKIKLQGYVTACYGSLTSFNVLFAEEEDRFRGTGGG